MLPIQLFICGVNDMSYLDTGANMYLLIVGSCVCVPCVVAEVGGVWGEMGTLLSFSVGGETHKPRSINEKQIFKSAIIVDMHELIVDGPGKSKISL